MQPLRLAVIINPSQTLTNWEVRAINQIQEQGQIQLIAFIYSPRIRTPNKKKSLKIFNAFENRWFNSLPDAFENISIENAFSQKLQINIGDTEKIGELNLNIIYCSYFTDPDFNIANYSKFGLWYYIIGTGKFENASPVAFWEVMEDCPEIGSYLMVKRSNFPNPVAVYYGSTTTIPYSVKNTLTVTAWKSASFLAHRINELKENGPTLFFEKYKFEPERRTNGRLYKSPSSIKLLCLVIRNFSRYLKNKLKQSLIKKRFTLLIAEQKINFQEINTNRFKPLALPKDTFWADPFILEKNGKIYIFFEEFIYSKNKAHISVIEFFKNGEHTKPDIVLEKPYHLSYPFVFEYLDHIYMIPETSENNTVELYKCIDVPFKWEFVQNIMENITLIDCTILFFNNTWWMFGTKNSHPSTSTNDQLFLYYTKDLFSKDWKYHPQNPVVTHISNCRPAGKIFEHNSKLYRPAQNNSSKQYGFGLKINEIITLTETEYQEKEVHEITPDFKTNLSAIHTINFTDNITVIDGIL